MFRTWKFLWKLACFVLSIMLVDGSIVCAAVRVVNEGVPGESSAEIDARLDAALRQYKPGVVVIFAGTNDAVNDRKFLPPEVTGEHIDAIARRSRAAGAQVVVINIHEPDTVRLLERHKPEAYGSVPPAERVRSLNQVLERIARRDHLALANFHDTLIKAGGPGTELSTDGVHLTAKGYGILAEVVRSALPDHLPNDGTILCMGDSLTYGIGVRLPGTPDNDQTYPVQLQKLLNKDSRTR
jgi:acyl-CoA thioesterase-1